MLRRGIRAATEIMRRAAIDMQLRVAMDRFERLLREYALERRHNPDWHLQPRVRPATGAAGNGRAGRERWAGTTIAAPRPTRRHATAEGRRGE